MDNNKKIKYNIRYLFYNINFDDIKIFIILYNYDFSISLIGLKKLYLEINLL